MLSKYLTFFTIVFALLSCSKNQEVAPNQFTGNEVSYPLLSTDLGFRGTTTFKEKKDGTAEIVVQLENTTGPKNFPVHLHYKSYDQEANLAALLEPVAASSGESITDLSMLADETPITYKQLIDFDGHISIHLDDNINKDVILSYGNIGINANKPLDARLARCYCKIGQDQ